MGLFGFVVDLVDLLALFLDIFPDVLGNLVGLLSVGQDLLVLFFVLADGFLLVEDHGHGDGLIHLGLERVGLADLVLLFLVVDPHVVRPDSQQLVHRLFLGGDSLVELVVDFGLLAALFVLVELEQLLLKVFVPPVEFRDVLVAGGLA